MQTQLLVPKTILFATVRALPGDAVAGQSPEVFLHAFLAHTKTTAASPAKRELLSATMTVAGTPATPPFSVSGFHGRVFHESCRLPALVLYTICPDEPKS